MTLITFLPIIIILIIVGVIFLVIKIIHSQRTIQVPKKLTGWAFLIYSLVLLVSVVLYLVISSQQINYDKKINAESAEYTGWQLHEAAREGRIDEISSAYLSERWTFEVEGDHLFLEAPGNDVNGLPIFVERKTAGDDSVEADFYQTPVSLEGIEIENTSQPDLEFHENTLFIRKPETNQLRFTTFTQEFPFAQFTGEGGMFHSISHGGNILYLKIPQSLELNTPSHAVQYVGE